MKSLPYIPYGKQFIDEIDIDAVTEVLQSDWLTTGPKVSEFERAIADFVDAKYAVAVSSGTAALHCAMYALNIKEGDEVLLPPMTFAATANCIVFQKGTPVFIDVEPDTLLIDPGKVEEKITKKTKAIVAVDYAGQPCDYDRLRIIADKYGLALISDGCHALGAEYKKKKVGSLADMTVFSFHPVKHITTGEGGIVTTDNPEYEKRIKIFRNHGINMDSHQRNAKGDWFYEMIDLGYNYRITDIQCALGISQLKKLHRYLIQRRRVAKLYDQAFAKTEIIMPIFVKKDVVHAYHLYVVQIHKDLDRSKVFEMLRQNNIGVNVHYIPVHLHPYYRKKYNTATGMCPIAEDAFNHIISLPIFYELTDDNVKKISNCLMECIRIRKAK